MKKIFLILSITAYNITVEAQNTLRPSIYFQNMNFYNPAAGKHDTDFNHNLSLYAKGKFVDDDNDAIWVKPVNIYLNYLGNLNAKSFLNLSYVFDGYSFYKRHTLYAGYGRTYPWGKSGKFSVGARAILNFDRLNWDKITHIADKPPSETQFTPDLDLGMQLQLRNFTLGISAKNLFASSVKADNEVLIKDWRELYVNASYTFNLFNEKLRVSPYLLYFLERDFALDAGINISLFKTVDVSYALRLLELRSIFSTKVAISRRLLVGASVDHAVLYSDTNLDFLIGYNF